MQRVEGAGNAVIYRGDPRQGDGDIDQWWQDILREVRGASSRPYLWGADAGLCARRNVLLEHNNWVSSETSPASQAYMAIGVGLENMLAAALQRRGRLIRQSAELPEMPGLKVRGKIDLVAFDHEDKLSLIEVKTCGKLPTEPRPTHLAQIQTYCAISGVDRAWLTYLSRDVRHQFGTGLSLRSFAVPTDRESLTRRLATAALSRLASDTGALPPVPAAFRKHTECHYCEFRDAYCWNPRPGLESRREPLPLPELDTPALANLLDTANATANRLQAESSQRYWSFLGELVRGSLPLATEFEEALQNHYRESVQLL